MKKQLMNILAVTLTLASCLSDSAWAGDKGLNGGGGEVEFAAIQQEITAWMDARMQEGKLGQKLGLADSRLGLTDSRFHSRFTDAVRRVGNRVKFQDGPIKLRGFSTNDQGRICGNDSDSATIVCNNANWSHSSAQIKYAIVLHEYLGVAEIETNQGEYSRYPVSSNILRFVKRSEKFELGAESVIRTSCPDLNMNGIWKNGLGGKFKIEQKKCKLFFGDLGDMKILYKIPLNGSEGTIPDDFYLAISKNGTPFVAEISYTVSIDNNGIPAISFRGVNTNSVRWMAGL